MKKKDFLGVVFAQKFLDELYKSSIEYFVHWRQHFREFFLVIFVLLFFRSFLGVVYRIPSGSMIPTFREGDMLLSNRFYYGLKWPFTEGLEGFRLPAIRPIERGDVIIFRAPTEEVFHQFLVPLEAKHFDLYQKINEDSSFKRPISLLSGQDIAFSFLGKKNYIFSDNNAKDVVMHIHEDVWKKYKKNLLSVGVVHLKSWYKPMTYQSQQYKGVWKSILSTPFSGLSLALQTCYDSPFFFASKSLLMLAKSSFFSSESDFLSFLQNIYLDKVFFVDFDKSFKFYPNRYVDLTKEYVKRVVAMPGDKIEIKNKILFVNGIAQQWVGEVKPDDDKNGLFFLTNEKMPLSSKGKEKSQIGQEFTHPIRFSTILQPMEMLFDEKVWPYDPASRNNVYFRDNFGPVVVPQGHYFAMGDNRDQSLDSRFLGFVPEWAISGTPMFIFYPFSRAGYIR